MKKTETSLNGNKKRYGLFFNIGLFSAMLLVVSAFEYEAELIKPVVKDITIDKTALYLPPVTTQIMPAPPKPKPMTTHLTKLEAGEPEILADESLEIPKIATSPETLDLYLEPLPNEKIPDEPFLIVENMPSPKGGLGAFYRYISKNLRYPRQARKLDISGKVIIQFVINEVGELTALKILKGIGAGCEEEVIRLFKNAPPWEPGKQRGKPVKVKQSMTINFRLD